MNYKTKSIIFVAVLIGMMVGVGLLANFNDGLTGASVAKIACNEDADCDDGIAETTDVCRSPGTQFSMCVNKLK